MSEAVAVEAPVAAPVAPVAPAAVPAEGGAPAQNTADSAVAAPEGGEKPDTPEQAEKRGKSRFERKISRLYREAAEAKAERDLYKRQLEEAKPRQADDPAAPKLENYQDIEKYAEAKAKYATDKAMQDRDARQQSETQKQAQARLTESWEERSDRGESKYEDFSEVVGELRPSSPWAMAIMEAENGEDIAYHLGKNLKEAQRIASLPPLSQIREIGRLEAKLTAEPPVKPKKPSAAPAPIAPLQGTSPVLSETPSPNDDDKTWFAKRLKAGGRGR